MSWDVAIGAGIATFVCFAIGIAYGAGRESARKDLARILGRGGKDDGKSP